MNRPLGVTALGCFFCFGVLMSGLSMLSLLFPGGPLEGMWRLNPVAHERFLGMGHWAILLFGPVCLACAATAIGFFRGTRWGYRLGVALLAINLLGDVVNSIAGIEPRSAFGIPIVGLLLWYLSSLKVKRFFAPTLLPSDA